MTTKRDILRAARRCLVKHGLAVRDTPQATSTYIRRLPFVERSAIAKRIVRDAFGWDAENPTDAQLAARRNMREATDLANYEKYGDGRRKPPTPKQKSNRVARKDRQLLARAAIKGEAVKAAKSPKHVPKRRPKRKRGLNPTDKIDEIAARRRNVRERREAAARREKIRERNAAARKRRSKETPEKKSFDNLRRRARRLEKKEKSISGGAGPEEC